MENLNIKINAAISYEDFKKWADSNGLEITSKQTKKSLNQHSELDKIKYGGLSHQEKWYEDSRYNDWCDEEQNTGYSDKELWNLDSTMVELLYERLVGFKPMLNRFDTGNLDLKSITSDLLDKCKYYLTNTDAYGDDKIYQEIWDIWGKYGQYFWD
mgnify:CR=1 FL=1